jgi:amidohydrolase
MAGAEIFWMRISGKGGHGAQPHQTKDPIAAAVQWISAVQTVVSRNVGPLESAVVSVTSVHGGDAFNVIPQSVELQGTIRTFDPVVRQMVIDRFKSTLYGIVESMGCTVELKLERLTPAVINDPWVTSIVQGAARDVLPGHTIVTAYQTMGSEDMAEFLEEIPGCYLMIGSANPEKGLDAGHHHPKFDFDEDVLPQAAALMAGAILRLTSTEK